MQNSLEFQLFTELFKGNQNYYGCHLYKQIESGVKEKGKSFTKNELLTLQQYENHIKGIEGLGISPLNDTNEIQFAVFDIDIIDIDIKPFLKINYEYDLPFNLFRSKSGGLHIYVFFKNPVNAKSALLYMRKFALIFGLDKKTEIFPKQERLLKNQQGNWINLPYYNGGQLQYLYSEQGKKLPFADAMKYLQNRTITLDQFKIAYDTLPHEDAPVCIQACLIHKKITNRNIFLFDTVTYLKVKKEDYENKIIEINNSLIEPLDYEELYQTVIKSQAKKTYSYRCKESPLCDYCNKDFCKERTYGIGGGVISKLNFENLTQVKADQPYYKWTVNGSVMTFYSEQELRDQNKFADYCMRELHLVPNTLKRENWYNILNEAFKEIIVEEIDKEDDISPGALLHSYLEEFLINRAYAKTREQVLLNRVYKNEDKKEFVFKKESFINFLYNQKSFKLFTIIEIQERLRKMGGTPKKFMYDSKHNRQTRVWGIPFELLGDKITEDGVNLIDFSEFKDKEDF